jgi:predicted negative regulator of RcsB-dependent stress response
LIFKVSSVDEFLTDEERGETAKRWVRENGLFLAAGVVLGLGLLFGWQYWEENKLLRAGEAAVIWEQLQEAAEGERFNEVEELLAMLESDYASTPYLDQSRLSVAHMHMDRNSSEEALAQLNKVVAGGGDAAMRKVAELRVAQIYLYQERYDEALAIVGPEDGSAFVAQHHEVRGDIFFAQGEYEAARDEYSKALEMDKFSTVDRSFVQMKLDDVTGTIARMAKEPATAAAETE